MKTELIVIAENDGPDGILPPLQSSKNSLNYWVLIKPNEPWGNSLSNAFIDGNILIVYAYKFA